MYGREVRDNAVANEKCKMVRDTHDTEYGNEVR